MLPGLVQGVSLYSELLLMEIIPLNTFTLMLRCPHLGTLSSTLSSLLEENLLDVIQNYESVVFDDVHNCWMQEGWATQVWDRLYDQEGELRCTGNQHEYWNAVKYGSAYVEQLAAEADSCMSQLMADNHELLLETAEFYIIEDLSVARKIGNLWIVHLRGARYG